MRQKKKWKYQSNLVTIALSDLTMKLDILQIKFEWGYLQR